MIGPRLGHLHAWRDRGSVYVEGFRTSVQAGLLGAGVAKGAGFTEATAAIWFGCAIVLGLEVGKLVAGWLDYRYHVIQSYQGMVTEANPITMRQVNALEKIEAHLAPRPVYEIVMANTNGGVPS
jgi:hypothetical protein